VFEVVFQTVCVSGFKVGIGVSVSLCCKDCIDHQHLT
jgi:hypothetical protein